METTTSMLIGVCDGFWPKAVLNAVKGNQVNTARPKVVLNAVKGNQVNAVKASACWVWKPKTKVIDHGNPQIDLQDQGVIDSGCSRHMTWNMSYLTDYKEIYGGYVAFGGNPKGEKITDIRVLVSKRIERSGELKNRKRVEYIKNRQSGEDRLKLEELMEFCTKLQQRVLDLENTKTAQAQEITSLKLRVKKLEKKGGSRTHKLKRLYKVGRSARMVSSDDASLGDQEDASKQGRKINDIDKDTKITLIDETQGRYGDDLMFDTGVLDDEEVFAGQDMDEKEINVAEKEVSTADPVTTAGEVVTTASPTETTTADDLTLAQTLIEIRSAKSKVKGVVIGEQSESTTRTRPQQLPSKDKGKGIMEEPEKPTKKKDQIRHDEEVAQRLQAQMQAELEEEDRLVRQREEEANIVSWDNVQAMIDADYQMDQQMQA
ncbi:hypothetical protein Tco_0466104 [Tanacetum coccineum]